MLLQKRFNGILDKDSRESDVLAPNHIQAKNLRFIPNSNGGSFNPVKGNTLVVNSGLPAGTNECIGAFFDQVKQRIIWFNWNQYGNNGIYQYSIQSGTVSKIFLCNTDSATDILNFSLDYPVHSAAIVYRTTGDGDLLYWTDGYNRPRYLNLDTVATLAPFTEDMINAAKDAPLTPPDCEYQDNSNVTFNNLRKKLFRFCYRWVYKNGEKSTFSPISKVPLPVDGYDPTTQNDPTLNNNILVQVTAGGDDYESIEIAAQSNINDTWSDFVLIEKLGRDEYNILPDATYDYYFYNDGAYVPIDPEQTDLYFSWLPDKANTLELLNGNVIIYGGLTDGYDKILREDVDVIVTTGLSQGQVTTDPSISYNFSDSSTIVVSIGSVITPGVVYSVDFDWSYVPTFPPGPTVTGSVSVDYTTQPTDTQNDVVNGLLALISGGAISCTNLGGGNLQIFVNVGFSISRKIENVVVSVNTVSTGESQAAWKYNYNGRLGLIYFDERGKTNGVVSFMPDAAIDTNDFTFNTAAFSTSGTTPLIPFVSASINHTPPTWATSYQWVRANNLPKFLYWITNDYQSDSNFLYLGIQNLIYQKTQDSGFVPGYEFAQGDRVRIIALYSGGNFTPYNVQLDMEILGTIERTMQTPNAAENGTFLKVQRPTVFPTFPQSYQLNMLVEIYTPKPITGDESQLFYEWGEKFDIYESGGVRYHRGQTQDQTASQAALFQWYDGDVYYKNREFFTAVNSQTTITEFIMDANYSDYFQSAVNSNGRGWVIDENAKQEYNPVIVRWGGKYQAGTNINQLNIFRPSDFDEVDRSKGDIRRFKVRDRILRVFQDRGIGQYGIYARFIQNNEGENDLVTTNEIITTNNIQYYQGIFGLCGYPTNLCSSPIADYFTDVVTGRGIRLGNDGLTDLGVLYKGQFYFPQLVTPYNKDLLRSNGATAKVMAFYDSFDGDFHTILQAGTGGGVTAAGGHFAFNELRNGYICDEYSYIPEWAICANDVIYSWNGGHLWKHDNNTTSFYNVAYAADVTFVFNDNLIEKKSWNAVSELANTVWSVPLIYTNVNTYAGQRQETNIGESEFQQLEQMPSAAIKRDVHSTGGKINGNFMKGNWMAIKFRKENATNLVFLNEIAVRSTDSPRTDR